MRKFEAHPLGTVFEDTLLTAFFGGRLATPDALAMSFPDFEFVFLKQTHSNIVVRSPSREDLPEADAHYTKDRRLALCVRTADCMPVLIHDPSSGLIASIHAGWRGIENEIIRKTGEKLKRAGASLGGARAWIGPHIGANSVEVDEDVALKLEARLDAVRANASVSTALLPHDTPGKKRVDLLAIARAQLGSIGVERERTMESVIDTMTSLDYESFRRDRECAKRQISFIALK